MDPNGEWSEEDITKALEASMKDEDIRQKRVAFLAIPNSNHADLINAACNYVDSITDWNREEGKIILEQAYLQNTANFKSFVCDTVQYPLSEDEMKELASKSENQVPPAVGNVRRSGSLRGSSGNSRSPVSRGMSQDQITPMVVEPPSNYSQLIPPVTPNPIDILTSMIATENPTVVRIVQFLDNYKIVNLNVHNIGGLPPLAFVIVQGREDLFDLFLTRGADINIKTRKGNSMLFVALKMKGVHRGRMVKILLQNGADITQLDDEGNSVDHYADTPTMKYWIERARHYRLWTPEIKDTYNKVSLNKLPQAYFSLVGQEIATDAIVQHIYGKMADPQLTRKPVVLFLVGPPGHGKSQIARDIMNTFGENDSARINCGDIVDPKWQLFGSEAGYVGTTEGTGLSNFMANHHGRRGVVVFEEFEKLGDSAKEALLHPFEAGEWSVKKPGSTISVNCSNIVFIMTSNLKNQEIIQWLEENRAMEKYANADNDHHRVQVKTWIIHNVSEIVKNDIKRGRVKEFARRIEVIPFVSFTPLEQFIIVEETEDRLAGRYIHPPSGDRVIGGLKLQFTERFGRQIVDGYDPLQGATSLVQELYKMINTVALEVGKRRSKQQSTDSVWFYIHPEYHTASFEFQQDKPEEKEKSKKPHFSHDESDVFQDSNNNNNAYNNNNNSHGFWDFSSYQSHQPPQLPF